MPSVLNVESIWPVGDKPNTGMCALPAHELRGHTQSRSTLHQRYFLEVRHVESCFFAFAV